MKRVWLMATAALVLALAGRAWAEPKVFVEGDDKKVTKAVRAELDKDVELVDESEAVAIVRIDVKKAGKKYRAIVTAVQVADDKVLAKYEVKAKKKKLAKAAAAKARKKLSKALRRARSELPDTATVTEAAPPPEEPAPAPETAEPPETPEVASTVPRTKIEQPLDNGAAHRGGGDAEVAATVERPRKRRTAPWLEVEVDGRPFLRTLRYNDDLNGNLRTYDLAAPAVGASVAWRPVDFLAIRAEGEMAVGVNGSETDGGMQFGTKASEFNGGLRAGFGVGGARVAIDAAYGEQRFEIEDEGMPEELVPDVRYRYVRGGVAIAVPLGGRVRVDMGGGYRHLLATGEIGEDAWFPRLTGAGIDAELGLTLKLGGPVTAHVRGDVRRYYFAMNPEVGDALIAGGAVDQYLAVVSGLAIELR